MTSNGVSDGRIARHWRRIRPGRNPLARPGDRWDGRLLVAIVVLAVCAVPMAVSWGMSAYAQRLDDVARDEARTHAVVATLTETAPASTAPGSAQSVRAEARWNAPDGSERTGTVPAYRGATRGTEITVWLDRSGTPTSPPLTRTGAAVDAATVGAGSWLAVLSACGVGYGVFRLLLARSRDAWWDREWARANAEDARHRKDH